MSSFAAGDSVRIRDDELVGVVVQFGIGLGDNTPERLQVQVAEGDVREVFASACDRLSEAPKTKPAIPVDPPAKQPVQEPAQPPVNGDGDTLAASGETDTRIDSAGDTVAADDAADLPSLDDGLDSESDPSQN